MACLPADSIDPKPYIEIVGLIKEPHFYVAKSITQGLIQKFPRKFVEPTIRPLLEFDWHAYLCNQKRELRGVVWEFSSSVMCFLDGNFIGDEGALATWAENQWGFTCTPPQASCVKEHYLKHLQSSGESEAFQPAATRSATRARCSIAWYPKAGCKAEHKRLQPPSPLTYKIRQTDISPGSRGNGGESIYGPTFEDESFAHSHSKRAILGMANKGPHSNGSQFYITLQSTLWMDRAYVPFGQVVEGVDVLKRLEEIPTVNQRPKHECRVVNCGVLEV
ncbi:probable inactive peptidyl-prolyl cis-trans isomerase-like 6 isoform X3 [Nerophis lumbriciformis]|uniref:probable inactive peptidyl-prolyl cis-trans isomerase-like 6 isoform X3 n=1 Tax=Nerophis lumbriciformis TaxID=546530 RepID=UPI002ADFD562|nr:probable inactive peptidyl-prolyl cis-trans isomerase-like 6 isoform X3 [Nerophis lumbriciformis]